MQTIVMRPFTPCALGTPAWEGCRSCKQSNAILIPMPSEYLYFSKLAIRHLTQDSERVDFVGKYLESRLKESNACIDLGALPQRCCVVLPLELGSCLLRRLALALALAVK